MNRKSIFFFLILILNSWVIVSCSKHSEKENIPEGFFEKQSPLVIHIHTSVNQLLADRDEKRFYHEAQIYFCTDDTIEMKGKIKTRGYFRRDTINCINPPLKLKLKRTKKGAEFLENQNKIKLVLACANDSVSIQQLYKEYLAYKIYALLSPYSFQVRLCKLVFFNDKVNKKTLYIEAFMLESNEHLENRTGMKLKKKPFLEMEDTNYFMSGITSFFQFMIGNDDWSVYYLHNIKLLYENKSNLPVILPYDFDLSAFVGSPHANKSYKEKKNNNSLPEKLYRTPSEINLILKLFSEKKDSIFLLINHTDLLNNHSKKECSEHINKFYNVIENKDFNNEFFYEDQKKTMK